MPSYLVINNSILIAYCFEDFFCNGESGQVNFYPGELILKLLAWIGERYQNLSEYTGY